jgi:hypothetical protein
VVFWPIKWWTKQQNLGKGNKLYFVIIFFYLKKFLRNKCYIFVNNSKKIGHRCVVMCCNFSLGLTTKARPYKGAGQEWSSGITFHAPESLGKCEGMSPHTPKWAPILGIPNGFANFQKVIVGVKIHWIKKFLTSLKVFWNVNV